MSCVGIVKVRLGMDQWELIGSDRRHEGNKEGGWGMRGKGINAVEHAGWTENHKRRNWGMREGRGDGNEGEEGGQNLKKGGGEKETRG